MKVNNVPLAERREILESLESTDCPCGGKKGRMRPLCLKDMQVLPSKLRRNLYRGFGGGYEQAFIAAQAFLRVGKFAETENVEARKQQSMMISEKENLC